MDSIEKLYDLLAGLIQEFLSTGTDVRNVRTISLEQKKALADSFQKEAEDFEELLCVDDREEPLSLACKITYLDDKIYQELERKHDRDCLELEDVKVMDGLNSAESRRNTNILLLPRYSCIWEGKNRDEAHCQDVNILLRHSYAVVLEEGKVSGRYNVRNYVLDAGLYGVCSDENNEQRVSIMTSPVSGKIDEIKRLRVYTENGQNYFEVPEFSGETEDEMIEVVKQVIQRANENKNELLVFPEMLGTKRMQWEIMDMLQTTSLDYTKCICMPSIWNKSAQPHNNRNFCPVVTFAGEELFLQDKLKRYQWKETVSGEEYDEDIIEGDTIHLIHNRGYGSIAVLICKSELDVKTRNILVQDLNVKLLLCPSWSTGCQDFKLSIMACAERSCNVIWCNTCSALSEPFDDGAVSIISNYGRNREWSQLDFDGRQFPDKNVTCMHHCETVCTFERDIYGRDYSEESQVMDNE